MSTETEKRKQVFREHVAAAYEWQGKAERRNDYGEIRYWTGRIDGLETAGLILDPFPDEPEPGPPGAY